MTEYEHSIKRMSYSGTTKFNKVYIGKPVIIFKIDQDSAHYLSNCWLVFPAGEET